MKFRGFGLSLPLALSCMACGTGQGGAALYIRNGGLVQDDSDPVAMRTVALVTADKLASGQSFCSGTVVAQDAILTAAHCFMDLDHRDIRVVFSRQVKGAAEQRVRRVLSVRPHESFDPDAALSNHPGAAAHDLAVLKFEGELPHPFVITPLLVGNARVTERVTLAGFGLAQVGDPDSAWISQSC